MQQSNGNVNDRPAVLQQFCAKLRQIYMNLPVNFSSLTGWRYPNIPRLLGNPLIGRLNYLLSDDGILENLLAAGKLATRHSSGMCYFWLANKLAILITKPEQIKQVLITNDGNVSRRTATRFIESFWGPNISTDPYQLWKKKRTIYLDHLAENDKLAEQEQKMLVVIQHYINEITKNANETIDLRELLNKYTLDNVLNLLIPYSPSRNIERYSNYTEFVGEHVANIKNIFKWSLPTWIRKIFYYNDKTTPSILRKKMKIIFNNLLTIPHEDYIKSSNCFMQSIWKLRKDQPGQSSLQTNADVFGDTNALFFTAQDTVTVSLEFSIKLLSAHPIIEEKLRNELNLHLKGKEFTIENINKVEYLEMIIKEVLRLYPASPTLPFRGVDKPFKVDELPLSKGDLIIISPYLTHRLDNIWENPEQFDPERFSHKNKTSIPPHAYLPFGDGRHGCVGQKFAFQQMKLLLATIYTQYHIEIEDNDFSIKFDHTTIRPKNATRARFIPINVL